MTALPTSRDGDGDKRHSAVSPTLESGARDSGSSFCVSPIDEPDQVPRHERNGSRTSAHAPATQSQIAEPPLSQTAPKDVVFAPNHKQPTRWDDFSGEPSTTGKASHVNPRNTTFHKSSGHASSLLHWGREQLQSKKKLAQARTRISSFSKGETPAPTKTRRRSSSRVFQLGEHSDNPPATTDANPQLNAPGLVPTVVTTITAGDSEPLPARPATEHAYMDNHKEQRDAKFGTAGENMLRPQQYTGQFGAAGGNPQHIHNGSPQEGLHAGSKSTDELASVMSRQRPVPVHMPTSKKPVRKPTPSETGQQSTLAQPPVDDRPKDAQSRIASLDARRDELARRRFNLETVIKELTRVIQPTSIAYDLAAKAEVKKSVESIESEIAEIRREEHELGLKVTRAWRRLDEQENNGDGNNLWVKRVTS